MSFPGDLEVGNKLLVFDRGGLYVLNLFGYLGQAVGDLLYEVVSGLITSVVCLYRSLDDVNERVEFDQNVVDLCL